MVYTKSFQRTVVGCQIFFCGIQKKGFIFAWLKFILISVKIMSSEDKVIVKSLHKELVDLMLKKANVSKKTLYDTAISRFVNSNIDLLTPDELKKYHGILMI